MAMKPLIASESGFEKAGVLLRPIVFARCKEAQHIIDADDFDMFEFGCAQKCRRERAALCDA